jgi:hypothetical protein
VRSAESTAAAQPVPFSARFSAGSRLGFDVRPGRHALAGICGHLRADDFGFWGGIAIE